MLVKRRRGRVRGRHDDDVAFEEMLEQPPEDHRVGDVGHLHLIEAQEACFCRDAGGDMRDRIAVDLLARLADALVHVGHELMEMAALLGGEAHAGEEQVHQHRLAAADVAVDVEPARRRRRGA